MKSDHAIGQLDMADRDLAHAAHRQAQGRPLKVEPAVPAGWNLPGRPVPPS